MKVKNKVSLALALLLAINFIPAQAQEAQPKEDKPYQGIVSDNKDDEIEKVLRQALGEDEKESDKAEDTYSFDKKVADAKAELKKYLDSMDEKSIDDPSIVFEGQTKDEIKKSIARAKELLADEDIDQAKLEEIRQLFENESTLSIRRASQRLKLGYRTVQRALRNHIDFFPYKVQSMQSLTSQNFASRLAFARMIKTKIDRREININRVWFSDEAHFYLNGYVNKQNYRFWGSENPNVAVSRTLHPQRLTVWAALCAEGIIGPILFHSSVNSKNYLEMLRDTFIPTAHGLNKIASFWFQQDGARPSRSRDVFSLLYEHFGNQVIALDFKNQILFWQIVKEISKEKIVIVCTHEPNHAYWFSDVMLGLKDTKLKFMIDSNLINDELISELYDKKCQIYKDEKFIKPLI